MARTGRHGNSKRSWIWLILLMLLVGAWQLLQRDVEPAPANGPDVAEQTRAPAPSATRETAAEPAPSFLPPEAHATLALIDRGGPFPHRQDGTVFQNREGLLPQRPRGHYREYTVDTPGLGHRGARRIVTGGDPPAEWYYTADHYRSFREFERRP